MYHNSVVSTGQLIFMAVVVVASLAVWLTAVMLADRQPRGASAAVSTRPREEETGATVTPPPPETRPAEPAHQAAA